MLFLNDALTVTVDGASHSPTIGVTVSGLPDFTIDTAAVQAFLDTRKPNSFFGTPRKEKDVIRWVSGIENGLLSGEVKAELDNGDVDKTAYSQFKATPRPSHADYAAAVKYKEAYDGVGGSVFSGRMTAPLCIAGGICKQLLEQKGIIVKAYVSAIGEVKGISYKSTDISDIINAQPLPFTRMLDEKSDRLALTLLKRTAEERDSLGGVAECVISGVPTGLGGLLTGGLESVISSALFAIPGVKGVEFGEGFGISALKGSQSNDAFAYEKGSVITATNKSGGINGGLANGMPITFSAAFRPTPSIGQPQKTVDYATQSETTLTIKGRHDVCYVPRAVPAVESVAAIVILNQMLKENRI